MLTLDSHRLLPLGKITEAGPCIGRVADDPADIHALHSMEYLLVRNHNRRLPSDGFRGYLYLKRPRGIVPRNSFLLPCGFSYLEAGDIIRIDPGKNSIRTAYRVKSAHNILFLTERCNHFCLMCPQPPRPKDEADFVEEALETISLMSPVTRNLCITGGEPALLGDGLIRVVQKLKSDLESVSLHILTNGSPFENLGYCRALAAVEFPDLTLGIPLYSDISWLHDYVVQANGAFDDTIRGILNLKTVGLKVEIRVVIHKATYQRLPDLARFIRRNLTFCDHVALMGLEITGFARHNLEKLWIDPYDYQIQLTEAIKLLAQARIPVSIYNHPLCLLPVALRPYNRKSISDWKNEYMPECIGCGRQDDCGGFFSSAWLRHSAHIHPF